MTTKNPKNLRITVLKGGWTSERQISLKSGAAVEKGLRKIGYCVSSFDIKDKGSVFRLLSKKFDVAFIALHGKFGEDGHIQAILEAMRVCYTGSGVMSSAIAMNKIYTKKIFEQDNIPTPKWQVAVKWEPFKLHIPLPVVVKPSQQGSAVGISIVEKINRLKSAARLAMKYDEEVIIEEYIRGREMSVGVLGNKPLAVVELNPKRKFYDYKAKYTNGLCTHIVPAPMPKKIYGKMQDMALRAHLSLGCSDYSRVDIRYGVKGMYVLEVNTIPGMTEVSLLPESAKAAGIGFEELLKMIVEMALAKRQ